MQKRGGMSFWDILARVVLIGIALWLLLKLFGVINSPVWIEYSPLFGAIYLAGWGIHKLDRATEDIKDLKDDFKVMKEDMRKVHSNIENLRHKQEI